MSETYVNSHAAKPLKRLLMARAAILERPWQLGDSERLREINESIVCLLAAGTFLEDNPGKKAKP